MSDKLKALIVSFVITAIITSGVAANGEWDPRYDNEDSYTFLPNHKFSIFTRDQEWGEYFRPSIYPFVQCVEELDEETELPWEFIITEEDPRTRRKIYRAHFGYYSSYSEPYGSFIKRVCRDCSVGFSYNRGPWSNMDMVFGPTDFVPGYSNAYPNSAFHLDFDDSDEAFAGWRVYQFTAIASKKTNRCPTFKYSRLIEPDDHIPDVDYIRQTFVEDGPYLDRSEPQFDAQSREAGYTYLGQFLDHDITKDMTPENVLDPIWRADSAAIRQKRWRQWEPFEIPNHRTPLLDLDCLYGRYGRQGRFRDPRDPAKLRVGNGNDVPRFSDGTADIGDGRNDENMIVSQVHYAFIAFHNKVVDWIRQNDAQNGRFGDIAIFERAQRLVRWHYQYLILNTFLPRIVRRDVLEDVLANGPRTFIGRAALKLEIPIEFSAGAYRLHSMVRHGYPLNLNGAGGTLFDPSDMAGNSDLRGGKFISRDKEIDWRIYFQFEDEDLAALPGRLIDEKVVASLMNLPSPPRRSSVVGGDPISLPMRTLLRGCIYGLASGERAAQVLGVPVLLPNETEWYVGSRFRSKFEEYRRNPKTPLWHYLQREAMIQTRGERLGILGSIIVAETRLLRGDVDSYLNREPNFRPFLYAPNSRNGIDCRNGKPKCEYKMQDIIDFAGLRGMGRRR